MSIYFVVILLCFCLEVTSEDVLTAHIDLASITLLQGSIPCCTALTTCFCFQLFSIYKFISCDNCNNSFPWHVTYYSNDSESRPVRNTS